MNNSDCKNSIKSQFRQAAKAVCQPVVDTQVDSQWSDHNKDKSYAQVEIMVRPQVVSPKSGGLKPKRRRPYRLMARFTPEERVVVHKKAMAAQLSMNEYIRASVLGADYRPPLSTELYHSLLDLYRELTRHGTNLNQIARKLNAGFLSTEDASRLLAALAPELSRVYTAIYQTLANGRDGD